MLPFSAKNPILVIFEPENEKNMSELIEIQDENDMLFLKESLFKVKNKTKKLKDDLEEKTIKAKKSFEKIKDK